jgi:dTMP kinase
MIPNPFDGKLFAFEGMDGCGKSRQLEMATEWLRNLKQTKHRCFVVEKGKEPGRDRFWGSKIYQELDSKRTSGLPVKNLYGFQSWYAEDSKSHMPDKIRSLKVGNIVLMDRYRLSMVFGVPHFTTVDARTEALDELMKLNQAILGEHFIWPDASFIFDVSVETAITRLKKKFAEAGKGDFDEHEKGDKLELVRSNYLLFARLYPNCHVIDAEGTPEVVFEKVKAIIEPIILRIPSLF